MAVVNARILFASNNKGTNDHRSITVTNGMIWKLILYGVEF